MPKLPRWNAAEAEIELLKAGFHWLRSKGSHRIYARGSQRAVIPFHGPQALHPKIIKQVIEALELPGH